ncbi:MAG: PP2C family serine/threonine-protein phosphatase, partial [Myxococcota bacterium]
MKLVCAGMTDVGIAREHNEDDFYLSEGREALCIVADGMGGQRSGEVASALAIKAMVEYYRETLLDDEAAQEETEDAAEAEAQVERPSMEDSDAREAETRPLTPEQMRLVKAIKTANRAVFAAASSNESYRGMGTTIVSGFFTGHGVYLAHIGDSRAYRFREGELMQRTEDHSLANEYVRMGILSAEDVEYFPYKNVITRACGLTDEVEVDIHYEDLKPGDLFLFCSDGLSDMVPDAEILDIVQGAEDLELICRELVERANANGG